MTPDQSLLLLTLGVLLIYIELNRPGWIVPGALGLLLSLLSIAHLLRLTLNPVAVVLSSTAILILLAGLRRILPLSVAIAATTALTLGFASLHRLLHLTTAVPCGLLLGLGTSYLTRIARRARTNKGLD
jgi:membrane-bound serine protease (ClpP class)